MKLLREITSHNDKKFQKYYETSVFGKFPTENDDLHNKLSDHYKDIRATHRNTFRKYTENSLYMNSHLWNKHKKHEDYIPSKMTEKYISGTNKALKSYKTPEDMTVYSSTIHDPRKLKNKEGIVHHPAFLSTSIEKRTAFGRNINSIISPNQEGAKKTRNTEHHILKIHVPKGHSGAYVGHFSNYDHEKEFILPKGSNLKYHDTDSHSFTEENPQYGIKKTHTVHIHHMEVVQ